MGEASLNVGRLAFNSLTEQEALRRARLIVCECECREEILARLRGELGVFDIFSLIVWPQDEGDRLLMRDPPRGALMRNGCVATLAFRGPGARSTIRI